MMVCASIMIITGCTCPAANTLSLLERNQQRALLNESLFDAVENGQADLVRDLLRHGADADVREDGGGGPASYPIDMDLSYRPVVILRR
jgi:hypothetical protein